MVCVYLLDVSVESALLAEDVSTVRADDSLHIVLPPHVRGQICRLLATLGTRQILETSYMNLEPVDVERGLVGELLVAVRAPPD